MYDELRNLAAQRMAQEKPGQTLEPTALVHLEMRLEVDPCERVVLTSDVSSFRLRTHEELSY